MNVPTIYTRSKFPQQQRNLIRYWLLRTVPLDLMTVLGQYFQIRDDYKNLTDNVVSSQQDLLPVSGLTNKK